MSETNKDLQRRELVFRVLDDLKQSGERINADKVARLAQMGKQTVLPYYNEWRFLDDSEKEVDTELPADLVRVLKRGLVQWKHEATEEQRSLQEEANQEIDNLQEMNRQLSEERLNFKEQSERLAEEQQKLQETIAQLQAENTTLEKQQVALQEKLNNEIQKAESLTEQIEQTKKDHANALKAQERQLDTKHDAQMNHWMKVVDDERRLRADIELQLKQEKESQFKLEKERNEIQYRLESKSRAHLEACEERNHLRQHNNELAAYKHLLESVQQLINSNEEELISDITQLKDISASSERLDSQLSSASLQVQQLQEKLEQSEQLAIRMHQLEKELEKERGFSEALKLTLSQQTSQSAQNQ
ncbi:DNA-binding protein [Endozoicomonas euniceicola]|uniref:DNA-binding protein n=1 Tax=Endozoicomonas euniceicola TaxID=1234143 RepID=A0ABY6GTY4_9GAMM|nr:DNA-binding protein [Endozoicomonas euniceicola]UYM15849.1 DNA-binding protein [Endozoicomonas euniceicola]